MASGEPRTGTVTVPGGDNGPDDEHAKARELGPQAHVGSGGIDASEVVDRTAAVVGRAPGPFSPRQLARIDEALTLSSRETGLGFSVYVGTLEEPTREHAERMHARLPAPPEGVLLAVSPDQRVLHIVTGEQSVKRLPDRAAALAALSMRASLTVGDLVGALVNGLRMLSDQAGRGQDRQAGMH